MRVLFLDDSKERHEAFEKATRGISGADVFHVHSAGSAIWRLGKDRFDLVCLDYDLGEVSASGAQVAVFIARLPKDELPTRVFLHTLNRYGMLDMASVLRARKIWIWWYPFGIEFLNAVRSVMVLS